MTTERAVIIVRRRDAAGLVTWHVVTGHLSYPVDIVAVMDSDSADGRRVVTDTGERLVSARVEVRRGGLGSPGGDMAILQYLDDALGRAESWLV